MSDISRDCVGFPLFFGADECQSRPNKRSFSKSRKCKAQREKGRLNQSIGSSGFASFLRLRSRDPATFRRSKQTWGVSGIGELQSRLNFPTISFSPSCTFECLQDGHVSRLGKRKKETSVSVYHCQGVPPTLEESIVRSDCAVEHAFRPVCWHSAITIHFRVFNSRVIILLRDFKLLRSRSSFMALYF